jgi:ISXO2-like transposase domain
MLSDRFGSKEPYALRTMRHHPHFRQRATHTPPRTRPDSAHSLAPYGEWSYPPAIADTYGHKPFNIKRSGLRAHEVLPGVHRVASLLKRWLAGTHQSGISAEHLQAYLDEFTFRFNRRHSRARGLLFLRLLEGAVTAPPTTMKQPIKVPDPRPVLTPPPTRPVWPESLAAEPLDRPWRDIDGSDLLP